jgi:predicted amidophosphoribosyltransferase
MAEGLVVGIIIAIIIAPVLMLLQKKCPHCESRIPLGSKPRVCSKCGRDLPSSVWN